MVAVRGETINTSKGDNGDRGITKTVEMIAHGDHVFLARQSSEMTVQDQHQRSPPHLARLPRPTVVVDEFDVRQRLAHAQGHRVGDRRPGHHQRRTASVSPVAAVTNDWTCRAVGLTMALVPMVTVGTVSFPLATDRTNAAASGSSQMFTSR